MGISLEKGQRVTLSKEGSSSNSFKCCLGWDPIKQKSKGLLGSMFGSINFDADASAILLDENDKEVETVYFGNLKSNCGSVVHSGDNLTGAGDGDDEIISINLNKLDSRIAKVIFVVNIYKAVNRKQDFSMVENSFIRVLDSNNIEIMKYNLTDNYAGKTTVYASEIYKKNNEWKFMATGNGGTEPGIKDVIRKYN